MIYTRFRLMDPAGGAEGSGAGGTAAAGATAAPGGTGASGAAAAAGGATGATAGATGASGATAAGATGATAATGGTGATAAPVTPTWPDDWREKYAGADATKLEALKRYASPQAALDALFATKALVSKGIKAALPVDATPEQIAEFRKTNGIPEKADGYKLALSEGRVIGEADKPVIDKLLGELHGLHANPAVASKVVDFYYSTIEEQIAQRQELDEQELGKFEETLRAEYGVDYKRNIALAKNFMQGAGGEGKDSVMNVLANARGADGGLIFNKPGVVRALVQWAREVNPAGSFLPGGDEAAGANLEREIGEIKALMADEKSKYWKGPESAGVQARYRELLDVQSKIKQRKAA